MKMSEVKVGMLVTLECSQSPSKYVQDLHECWGQVESYKDGKVTVRAYNRKNHTLWVTFPPDWMRPF